MEHVLDDAVVCRSFLSKARGLMFSRKKTLVFSYDRDVLVPLHMFFVFFPIDVLYLDEDHEVIEAKHGFRPFSVYRPRNRARHVVEIPSPSGIEVGDTVSFK